MARIVVDGRVSRSWSTGVGVYTCRLLAALTPISPQHEYLLLTSTAAPDAPLPPGLGVTQIPVPYGAGRPAQHLRLPGLLRRLDAGLLVSMHPAVLPLRSPCPRLAFVHDLIPLAVPDEYSWAKRVYYRTAVGRSLRGAARVLVDSEATRRDCRRLLRLPDDKLRVVYGGPGIDASARTGATPQASATYFLYVGNKRPHKNLDLLLDAFGQLVRDGAPDCTLVIAGRDAPGDVETDGRRLRERAAALALNGRVRLAGEVAAEDLPSLYRGAVALVYLSSYEGLGLPPLEAMSFGTPVIALRRSSLLEVVGDGGLLLDRADPASVAGAMRSLLRDGATRRQLAERARRQAERFSWERTARAVLDEIETAVSQKEHS